MMLQTDLLVAAAKTGKVINIKKGQFCAASVMRNSAEKVRATGNPNVMVCERGTMFGYSDLIVDPRNLVWMRDANCPVVADITHSLQQPVSFRRSPTLPLPLSIPLPPPLPTHTSTPNWQSVLRVVL